MDTGEIILEQPKQEQLIINKLLLCSREIGRKEKYKDRIGLLVVTSGVSTCISLVLYLISSIATLIPLLFGIITAIGYFTKYIIIQDIFRLHRKYFSFKKELEDVRQEVFDRRHSE
jgi:hypothetical protein